MPSQRVLLFLFEDLLCSLNQQCANTKYLCLGQVKHKHTRKMNKDVTSLNFIVLRKTHQNEFKLLLAPLI